VQPGNIFRHGFHVLVGHFHGDHLHHLARIVGALAVAKSLQLSFDIFAMLAGGNIAGMPEPAGPWQPLQAGTPIAATPPR